MYPGRPSAASPSPTGDTTRPVFPRRLVSIDVAHLHKAVDGHSRACCTVPAAEGEAADRPRTPLKGGNRLGNLHSVPRTDCDGPFDPGGTDMPDAVPSRDQLAEM